MCDPFSFTFSGMFVTSVVVWYDDDAAAVLYVGACIVLSCQGQFIECMFHLQSVYMKIHLGDENYFFCNALSLIILSYPMKH